MVPARVHALTHGTSAQPPSAIASSICRLVTSLQEQTCGLVGQRRSRRRPAPAGRISSSGLAGSAMPLTTIGRSTPYAEASPTRMPPSSGVPSSETTSFL